MQEEWDLQDACEAKPKAPAGRNVNSPGRGREADAAPGLRPQKNSLPAPCPSLEGAGLELLGMRRNEFASGKGPQGRTSGASESLGVRRPDEGCRAKTL